MAIRTLNATQLYKCIRDVSNLFDVLSKPDNVDYAQCFAILTQLLSDTEGAIPTPVTDSTRNAIATMIAPADGQTRDWADFFAALAAFAKEIIPLISPLFS